MNDQLVSENERLHKAAQRLDELEQTERGILLSEIVELRAENEAAIIEIALLKESNKALRAELHTWRSSE